MVLVRGKVIKIGLGVVFVLVCVALAAVFCFALSMAMDAVGIQDQTGWAQVFGTVGGLILAIFVANHQSHTLALDKRNKDQVIYNLVLEAAQSAANSTAQVSLLQAQPTVRQLRDLQGHKLLLAQEQGLLERINPVELPGPGMTQPFRSLTASLKAAIKALDALEATPLSRDDLARAISLLTQSHESVLEARDALARLKL